jgi:hypothetical protein
MLLPQMPAMPACSQRLLRVALAALLSLGFLQTAASQTTYDEMAKANKAPNAIASIGNDLFGDQVNLYNGALEFHQTDVSLRGNSAIPVAVGRRFVTANRRAVDGRSFCTWELDFPRLHGVFSDLNGWNTESSNNQRCSQLSPPSPATSHDAQRIAGHKEALVKEYYETGTIEKGRMRRLDAVQSEYPTCSAKGGADMSRYSREMKKEHGL